MWIESFKLQISATQHNAPPARVLPVPEVDQSTLPAEYPGIKTKVSAFKPEVL